ncbi:hypothetical protein [Methanobacterium spitsbergense]|uniref:Uncharacterized protein n=1 Tax=Methanobacterium spitsbergense TaxID=2874285 RepID=A0A8T5UTR1_9EURY|nr:hypothetical protein [Methanobacterium spitsbergense]MBZ2167118.1 hypothetical protein [Methanobacterium spitsbergense]
MKFNNYKSNLEQEQPEISFQPLSSDKIEKLTELLKDNRVITESEYDLIFV